MSEPPERRAGLVRRVRAWARGTPNGDAALVMLAAGGMLIVVAAVLAIVVL
ncbi:hypothetical protein [Jatrophihabitans endophyticus]|uniref:hypothetical protein n=1 Tax=Jatrophihabitans endophyticus TaxID=1206085 RepID=UPI0013562CC0|nr:hypothetical protein [Jatrophihabitans endophyticus]